MTERKPPGMSFDDWIEQRIQAAQQRGEFDNLPGLGKPIPDIDEPYHEGRWLAQKLQRENIDTSAVLPTALALAKELNELPGRLRSLQTESQVRDVVQDFNARVLQAIRRPPAGPLLRVKPVDVDDAVDDWRADR